MQENLHPATGLYPAQSYQTVRGVHLRTPGEPYYTFGAGGTTMLAIEGATTGAAGATTGATTGAA